MGIDIPFFNCYNTNGGFMKKFVLITGGTRGLGRECVRLFAKNGYDVIFCYFKRSDLANDLVEQIQTEYNVKCYGFKCDVSKEEDINSFYQEVLKITNHIDVLVNNAGISCDKPIKEKSVLEFKRVLDVNLVGTFAIVKYFSKLMDKGTIINVASNDGIDACYKDEMDYAASKAGVISLTKTMAKEFAQNIRVNAVAPGWMDTDMSEEDIPLDELEYEKDLILLKRFASPLEVANVIYFLASDESSYINGEIIKVDGGY